MYVICICCVYIYTQKTVVFIYVLLDHYIPLCRVMGQAFWSRERSIIMMSSVKVIRHNCHVAYIYIIIMPSVIKHKIYIFQEKYKLRRVKEQWFTKYTSANPRVVFLNMFIYNSSFFKFVLNMYHTLFIL